MKYAEGRLNGSTARGQATFTMDFATMRQTNQTSGFKRRMHRQQLAARAPPPPTEVVAPRAR